LIPITSPYFQADLADPAWGGRVELQLKLRLDELRVLDPEPGRAPPSETSMTVHWRAAKPPSTVIHAGWLVRRRAGRDFLPNGEMARTSGDQTQMGRCLLQVRTI
jgi:hypothetical protein